MVGKGQVGQKDAAGLLYIAIGGSWLHTVHGQQKMIEGSAVHQRCRAMRNAGPVPELTNGQGGAVLSCTGQAEHREIWLFTLGAGVATGGTTGYSKQIKHGFTSGTNGSLHSLYPGGTREYDCSSDGRAKSGKLQSLSPRCLPTRRGPRGGNAQLTKIGLHTTLNRLIHHGGFRTEPDPST